jgi:hypothetical protein
MAIEVVIAAVGALASLGAGLFKQFSESKSAKSDQVTVTVQRGGQTIEKQGIMRPDEAARVLDMVKDVPGHSQPQASAK